MRQSRSLYWFVGFWFLVLAACSGDSGDAPTDPPDTSDAPTATETPALEPPATDPDKQAILFLGNSLAAGYGLPDSELAFPGLIQQKIDSLGWPFQVINAGISGETTAGGLGRISWMLRQQIDVLVLELGGNDGLRGINLDATAANLQAIIDSTEARYPGSDVVVAGMMVPPNLGEVYTSEFAAIFPALAERNDAALIPFLLEGVGGVPELNLPDGIHPTVEGHRIVAETVWETLRPVLEARMNDAA